MKHTGFTLVELLVVVLIIGILSAVALPQYQKAVLKSRYATLKHWVTAIAQAQEVYHMENGFYSNDIEELSIQPPDSTAEFQLNPGESEEEGDVRKKRVRTYDWGYCYTKNTGITVCYNSKIGMEYQAYSQYPEEPANRGSRWCVAHNPQAHQICMAETKRTRPSYSTNFYRY